MHRLISHSSDNYHKVPFVAFLFCPVYIYVYITLHNSVWTIISVCFVVVIAGHPTVLECIRFQGRQRTINIPQDIGTNYSQFGIFLLDDANGMRVQSIEHKHRGDAVQINTEILREWATGKGKEPVSWKTLTEVLHDIGLCTLANEIGEVKLVSDTSL